MARDRFLTHVSIFWFTATARSSARQYLEEGASDTPDLLVEDLRAFFRRFQ